MSKGVFDRLREQGEGLVARVSTELMQNPQFMKALSAAWAGKAKLDEGVGRALKQIEIPTRSEFKKAVSRIEALERQVEALKAAAAPPPPAPKKPAPRRRKPAAPPEA
ncbi:MAG: phasin family protein [Vicinamibacteria bacterium]|jgi:polyhydroxyalkanoate synthesis regulator phasin|nr:phasin family protein [Vicinamibacteria bacterium]